MSHTAELVLVGMAGASVGLLIGAILAIWALGVFAPKQ